MDQGWQGRHYFISCSSNDLDIAQQLRRDLKENGFEPWLSEEDIPLGTKWDDEIRKNIRRSIAVLYLVSPTSRSSQNVQHELEWAKIDKKNIIPLWVRGNNHWAEVVIFGFFTTQYVDFRDNLYKNGLEKLIQTLRDIIGHESDFKRYIEEDNSNVVPMKRTDIFISCNPKDKEYLEELQVHLGHFGNRVWSYRRILPGSLWRDELERALPPTKIAVFLVSDDLFDADSTVDYELNQLEVAKSEAVTLLPVILKSSNAFRRSRLARYQPFNPSQPIADMEPTDQHRVWSSLAECIRQILESQSG